MAIEQLYTAETQRRRDAEKNRDKRVKINSPGLPSHAVLKAGPLGLIFSASSARQARGWRRAANLEDALPIPSSLLCVSASLRWKIPDA
jgi:hypothetical protein